MGTRETRISAEPPSPVLSNAQIADRLAGLAQLLPTKKENPYKVKAYRRAAARIRSLSESLDELVRDDADLTHFPGIGDAIASAIREIVLTGALRKLGREYNRVSGIRRVSRRLASWQSKTAVIAVISRRPQPLPSCADAAVAGGDSQSVPIYSRLPAGTIANLLGKAKPLAIYS